jgi:bifunctional enzyme CysN/CysC
MLNRAIAFDLVDDVPATGRFVIVDRYEIRGGGIIREALEDKQGPLRNKVLRRDYKWEMSRISAQERASRFGQKPALVLITGRKDSGKKPLAKALEEKLHADGYAAYFIGIGNVLYGVDADIQGLSDKRAEHIRRLGEIAHILLEAGFILVVTAIELTSDDLETIQTAAQPESIVTVWVGDDITTDIQFDARLSLNEALQEGVARVCRLLRDKGILGVVK